jgi:hypothetical protein
MMEVRAPLRYGKNYETSRGCIVRGPQSVYRKGIQCNVEGKESCGNRTEVLQQVARVLLERSPYY